MTETKSITMVVSPERPDSRWVALDLNNSIISEGKTPQEVKLLADEKGKDYFMMFIPAEGNTYIF